MNEKICPGWREECFRLKKTDEMTASHNVEARVSSKPRPNGRVLPVILLVVQRLRILILPSRE